MIQRSAPRRRQSTLRAPGQRVIDRCDDLEIGIEQFFVAQLMASRLGHLNRIAGHQGVELAFEQRLNQQRHALLAQLNAHTRIGMEQARQDVGQIALCHKGRSADAQQRGRRLGGRFGPHMRELFEQQRCTAYDHRALRRGCESTCTAHKQREAEGRFNLTQGLAQRRLRQVQDNGRAAQTTPALEFDQEPQMTEAQTRDQTLRFDGCHIGHGVFRIVLGTSKHITVGYQAKSIS